MFYNYTPLLQTLFNKGITKKQLRETLQLSPATMARISTGEPIATETLGRICDYLKCSLEKIFTIEPTCEPSISWSSLNNSEYNNPKQTFILYLYFYLKEDNEESAEYIYGYAMPFSYTEEGMNIWSCSFGKDYYKNFCEFKGFLYKDELCKFLDAAISKHTIGKIFELLNIKIPKGIKPEEETQICNARVANGNLVYRPPFILPPETAYLDCIPELKPLLSYTENSTICECLYGTNKQQYYVSGNGFDADKIKLLWNYLSYKLPLRHNLNEAARLGNFEVLTYLQEDSTQKPVKCELWLKDEMPKGAKITIHQKLTGKYILRTKFYNGRNPISDNAFIINAQNKDENPVFIPLKENFFFAEIELWATTDTDKAGQRLLHQSSTPYIRQIALNTRIHERSMILKDRWSQAMKKQGQPVNTQVSFFSKFPNKPIGIEEEPWLKEENVIQKDFHAILGSGKRLHDNDAFFARGADKAVAFLAWLKTTLQAHPQTKRIILFDPFINNTAILKFIRSIKDTDIKYEIITDSYPAGRNIRGDEINTIKKLSSTLTVIATPCKLCVRTFTRRSGTLHDRVLIIADSVNTFVYALSNSLDSMAKDHSSIVTAVKPAVAQEIFSSYVQLVKDAENDNMIETLYDSQTTVINVLNNNNQETGDTTNTTSDTVNYIHEEQTYTKADFIQDYGSANTKKSLHNLAYMYYSEVKECVDYVLTLEKETEIKRLEGILNEAKTDTLPPVRKETGIYILNQNALVKQNFDMTGSLIEAAEHSIGWCFEFRSVLPYTYSYALKILWCVSPNHFIRYLENMVHEQIADNDESTVNAKLTPRTILIYSMVVHITKALTSPKITEDDLQALVKSDIPYLRALFAAKSIWLSEEFLKNMKDSNEYNPEELKQIIQEKCATVCKSIEDAEASTALIYFIKNLQVEICRNKHLKERIQQLIDIIVKAYVKTMLHNKKSDASRLIKQLTPLNMRNPGDICQITNALYESKYLNADQSFEILLHFWKLVYTKENECNKDHYDEETILRSNQVANEIIHTGNKYAEKLQKEITKISRRLCAKLYDPLFYYKTYNDWKNTVDQLACLFVTERYIVSQKNGFIMGKGETEYQKLTQNYDEILNDFSKVYKIWKDREFSANHKTTR